MSQSSTRGRRRCLRSRPDEVDQLAAVGQVAPERPAQVEAVAAGARPEPAGAAGLELPVQGRHQLLDLVEFVAFELGEVLAAQRLAGAVERGACGAVAVL